MSFFSLLFSLNFAFNIGVNMSEWVLILGGSTGHGAATAKKLAKVLNSSVTNNDKQITANELFAYLSSNVSKQAETIGREQQPQLLGGTDRIIAQW